jgi:hypothetical protein
MRTHKKKTRAPASSGKLHRHHVQTCFFKPAFLAAIKFCRRSCWQGQYFRNLLRNPPISLGFHQRISSIARKIARCSSHISRNRWVSENTLSRTKNLMRKVWDHKVVYQKLFQILSINFLCVLVTLFRSKQVKKAEMCENSTYYKVPPGIANVGSMIGFKRIKEFT